MVLLFRFRYVWLYSIPFIAVALALSDSFVMFYGWDSLIQLSLIWSLVLLVGYWGLRRWWPQVAHRALILTIVVIILGVSPRLFRLVAGSIAFLLMGAEAIWRWRLRRSLSVPEMAVLTGGMLNLFFLLYFVPWFLTWRSVFMARGQWHTPEPLLLQSQAFPAGPPDIYLIVLDGYGRSDVLQRWYGVDISPFLEQLRARGFWVVDKAYANYPRTNLTVATIWNMQYMHTLLSTDAAMLAAHKQVIGESVVLTSLRDAGYTIIQIEGSWFWSNIPEYVDVYVKQKPISWMDLPGYYLSRTPFRGLLYVADPWITWPSFENHRALIQHALTRLPEIAAWSGPKLVFAHIISPHPPFVFTADGSSRPVDYGFTLNDGNEYPGDMDDYRLGYTEQVRFMNNALLPAIDGILSASSRPAVIILVGDHGPGSMIDFGHWERSCLEERFPIFLALHLPGINPSSVGDVLTPVNIFRVVFNAYFEANLALLEDRAYAPYPGRIFLPVYDMTERLQNPTWYNCDKP